MKAVMLIKGLYKQGVYMKAELALPDELVEAISENVFNKIKPFLSTKEEQENDFFNVQGLADYMKVSTKWIYQRTHLKEIPYIKLDGRLIFRKRDIDKWIDGYAVPLLSESKSKLRRVA
jgi:hypothetical protein